MLFHKCSFRSYLKLFILSIVLVTSSASAIAPLNDDFANAILITGTSGVTNGTNVDATAELTVQNESLEPSHGAPGTPAASIWYKWVAPNTDIVDFDTQGSDYNTVLAVYTGTALNNLVQIGSNDDDALENNLQSRVSFTPVMSETYYIAVDGFTGAVGNVTLNFGPTPLTFTISGIVKLPASEIAPVGGLNITVFFSDDSNFNDLGSVVVTIPSDRNFNFYTRTMLVNSNNTIEVEYVCSNCRDYVGVGYYNGTSTTYDFNQATLLNDSSDHTDIDLTLLEGDTISGTISLPGSSVAPVSGLFPTLFALDTTNFVTGFSFEPVITEGQSSFDYKFTVPTIGNATWRLNYNCFECDGYLLKGYYADSGTTDNDNKATLLDGGMDNFNKDLVILRDESCFVVKASSGNVINFCL